MHKLMSKIAMPSHKEGISWMEQNLLSNTVQAVQNSMNNFVVAVFEILYDRKVIQIV